jgi:hypothetical protein
MIVRQRILLFVCPHGAGKSRIAAAWFNGSAPPGWLATTAGITPQTEVSEHAPRLLAGTAVAELLDKAPPRPLTAVPGAAFTVAIDCPAEAVAPTVSWRLDNPGFDEAMGAELRTRAQHLAGLLGGEHSRSELEADRVIGPPDVEQATEVP